MFELIFLRRVKRAHGLPTGVRQAPGPGVFRDVLYEEYDTIVELDGRVGHEGESRFRDMDRDNRSTVRGAATLRFGWHDTVGDPCRVARMIAKVLRDRGWTGDLDACPRCPPRG